MTNTNHFDTRTRSYHETRAIACIVEASHKLVGYGITGVIDANRSIAQARTHLTSIGTVDGPRTRKLWAVASKVERRVAKATAEIVKKG